MPHVDVSQVTPQEYHEIVRVHNLGFAQHIRKYGRFSGMRELSIGDIEEWTLDPLFNPKGLLRAQVNGDIVGYCYAKAREEANEKAEFYKSGHLERIGDSCSLLCIVSAWRRNGIGSLLLENAEQYLQSTGLKFAVAWVYKSDLPALKFLEKADYKHQKEFFIEDFSKVLPLNADVEFWRKDLTKEPLPHGMKLSPDYLVRPFKSGDEVHFAHIYNSVRGQCGREFVTVDSAKRSIYSQRTEQVFFVELDGKAVGCSRVGKDRSINLVGVIPEYQGRGIGTVLLLKTLKYLKRKGQKASYMGTGVPLRNALALYKKLGYRKVEELYCMVKELT